MATIILFTSYGLAGEKGFFVGAGASWSMVDQELMDDSIMTFKAFGGYEFNRFLAAELAYHNLGSYGESEPFQGEDDVLVAFDTQAMAAAIVLTLPSTDRFLIFTRLGVSYHEDDLTFSSHNQFSMENQKDWDLLGGVGTRFFISEHVALQGGWERLKAGDKDLDNLSMGIYWKL